jgi:hypothetical protein
MAYFIGPQLNEEYKDYLRRVLTDGGFYSRPNPKDFQNDVDTILPLNPIIYTPANAGKVSKMYSLIPDTGAGDFTVSRNGTATYFDKDGLLKTAQADEPRFEFDPLTGDFKGVLVEGSATNLVINSEPFTTNLGNKIQSISQGFFQNSNNVTRIFESSGGATIFDSGYTIKTLGSITQGVSTITSLLIRKGNQRFISINSTGAGGGVVDLDTNQIDNQTGATSEIFELNDGWKRIVFRFNPTQSTTSVLRIAAVSSFAFNASTVIGTFELGLLQLEIGSTNVTSYIPTVASTVTRPADIIDVTVPVGVTEIKETVNGVENTITSIPTTYQLPNGQVSRVIMT